MTKMKTVLLIGVAGSNNAFSLSLYNLKAYAHIDPLIRKMWDIHIVQSPLINYFSYDEKLAKHVELIQHSKPDLLAFSCYMWNIQYAELLARKLRGSDIFTPIVFGGPEMATNYIIDGNCDELPIEYCISGEGELTFLELLRYLSTGKPELSAISGLSFRDHYDQPFLVNEKRVTFKTLLDIPSPYLTGIVDDDVLMRSKVEANIETQRGCNLRCNYCVYHPEVVSFSEFSK